MHCGISVSVIVVLWVEDDFWSYGDLLVISAILLCCPKIDSNGVGDVGECWAILCLCFAGVLALEF